MIVQVVVAIYVGILLYFPRVMSVVIAASIMNVPASGV